MSKGLGKGLSALIADQSTNIRKSSNADIAIEEASDSQLATDNRDNLKVGCISPGQFQPRTIFDEDELSELADSVKKNGIVQPIIVRKQADNAGQYEIIAGERRWRAAKMNGMETVPVIIMDLDDKQALEIGIVENVQRQNLKLLEEAAGYKRLINEFNYTQEELSEVIGKSRSQISNTLRLMALPDSIKDLLNNEKLTAGHARALLTAKNAEELAEQIISKDLSVRQTEKLVKKVAEFPRENKKKLEKDPEIIRLENEVRSKIHMKVSITNNGDSGTVKITYHSLNELNHLIDILESASW